MAQRVLVLVCDWVSRNVYLGTEVRVLMLVVKIPQNFAAVKFTVAVSDHFHSLISCTNEVHFI